VFFKAEADAPYGEVVHLLDLARGAGARTLAVVTQPGQKGKNGKNGEDGEDGEDGENDGPGKHPDRERSQPGP
jgi:hypothetical protein